VVTAFDAGRKFAYMQATMTRAATFYGFWFSYPLTLAEVGTRA
jgi:hypothetical protein